LSVVQKLAAVSVDLDEVDCYAAIHGLELDGGLPATSLRAVYQRALPRLVALFGELGIPATFFAIGRDLEHADNRAELRRLHTLGHEIANHSHHHYYDLTRRSRAVQRAEVVGGADVIEDAVGVRPTGFRAPGYTITDQLFEVLAAAGVAYDSSVFPCPPYYFAKAAALALIRLGGRKSHSVLDDPRVLTAPADPYRIGTPYARRGTGLLELPIGVTSSLSGRLPFIGTSVVMAGTAGAAQLAKLASARAFVNLELHGIDLADAAEDGLLPLAPHQPDLRRSAIEKRAALSAAIRTLQARGFAFVTLAEAARRLG
jgi:peptidoglycan/xylan/chitin deacetylase (PgdA/CDA1 family)